MMLTLDGLKLGRTMDVENRVLPALVWMERCGVRFDLERWQELVDRAEIKAKEIKENLDECIAESLGPQYLFGKRVNWNSNAQVLGVLRNVGLNIFNTQQQTLEGVQNQHPIVPELLAYREANKRVGTYGRKWAKLAHPADRRIHASWRQIGAQTGRMACSKPNLQNLPRDPAYRACVRPEIGSLFVKGDYSQIELRIIAEIANDRKMKQGYIEGYDLHELTAMHVTGKASTEEVTPEERQMAKALNFGLIYGMGAETLAAYAKSGFGVALTLKEAQRMRNRFFDLYSGIRAWQQIQGTRTETRTVFGRRRDLRGNGRFTEKLNSPVQGSGADGLKMALALLWERRADCLGAFPVLTVHDEIVIEAPADRAEEARSWLIACMKDGMGEVLKEVPVLVETKIMESW